VSESESEIAPRLHWARVQAGLTHRDLAQLAKVSSGIISGLENGKLASTTGKVAQIARALGVEPCWLAYGDKDKAPNWWRSEMLTSRPARKHKAREKSDQPTD
jgi:transcriptional regulator with XRE-family HTH domain